MGLPGLPALVRGEGMIVGYAVGDIVEAKKRDEGWYPARVTAIRGPAASRHAQLAVRFEDGETLDGVRAANARLCTDYDWCKHLELCALSVGDRVSARFQHARGGKSWFPGVITACGAERDEETTGSMMCFSTMAMQRQMCCEEISRARSGLRERGREQA